MTAGHQPIQVTLSAYESAYSRLRRLARVLVYLHTHAESWSADVDTVTSLHDHKGTLEVRYTRPPNDQLRKLVEHAWAEECEPNVAHDPDVFGRSR